MPENNMTTEQLAALCEKEARHYTECNEDNAEIAADIKQAAARLRELEARNKVLEEVRKFYAFRKNWAGKGATVWNPLVQEITGGNEPGWTVAEKAGAK